MPVATDSPLASDALVMVLPGDRGQQLDPLTQPRTKGAVSFAGVGRLIDFTLANCWRADPRRDARPRPALIQASHARVPFHVMLAEPERLWTLDELLGTTLN